MVVRIISGSIFIFIIVCCILLPTIFLSIFLGIVTIIALLEMIKMLANKEISLSIPILLISGSLVYISLIQNFPLNSNFRFLLIGSAFFLLWIYPILKEIKNPLVNVAFSTFSLIYCVLPFVVMTWINEITIHENGYILLYVLVMVWVNDSFAYLIGRWLGKHKLIERISPNKTWEGFIGGFCFTLLMGFIISYFDSNYPLFWIISAAIISLGAVIGDLFESVMKRSVGVKDSGKIMPGHGGILDRFDAAMFAAPMFFIWYLIYFS